MTVVVVIAVLVGVAGLVSLGWQLSRWHYVERPLRDELERQMADDARKIREHAGTRIGSLDDEEFTRKLERGPYGDREDP